jgi:hypothetical protein
MKNAQNIRKFATTFISSEIDLLNFHIKEYKELFESSPFIAVTERGNDIERIVAYLDVYETVALGLKKRTSDEMVYNLESELHHWLINLTFKPEMGKLSNHKAQAVSSLLREIFGDSPISNRGY